MKTLIVNSAPYTFHFVDPIARTLEKVDELFEVVNYDTIPTDLQNYNSVIISASPKGNNIVNAQLPYFEWIKNEFIPILGICHGHQIIGVLFGSELIRDNQSEDGIFIVDILINDFLFEGLGNPLEVEQHHNNSITLPQNFNLLATSPRCKVQVIKHKQRPIYSTQFHCENFPKLILNFNNISKGYNK